VQIEKKHNQSCKEATGYGGLGGENKCWSDSELPLLFQSTTSYPTLSFPKIVRAGFSSIRQAAGNKSSGGEVHTEEANGVTCNCLAGFCLPAENCPHEPHTSFPSNALPSVSSAALNRPFGPFPWSNLRVSRSCFVGWVAGVWKDKKLGASLSKEGR
jgi:hypothetical protein